MKGIGIAFAVLAVAGTAHAERWVTTLGFADIGGAWDQTTLSRRGDVVTYWEMMVEPGGANAPGYLSTYYLSRIDIDCAQQTTSTRTAILYDKTGNVIRSKSYDPHPSDIAPQSIGHEVYRSVCGLDKTPAIGIADDPNQAAEILRKQYAGALKSGRVK